MFLNEIISDPLLEILTLPVNISRSASQLTLRVSSDTLI